MQVMLSLPADIRGAQLKLLRQDWNVDVQSFSTCNTSSIVYLILCKCLIIYVGSTVRMVKIRILEHCSRLRLRVAEAPLVMRFSEAGHKEDNFKYMVIYVAKPSCQDLRRTLLRKEAFWTYKLDTITPRGLNMKIDYLSYLG